MMHNQEPDRREFLSAASALAAGASLAGPEPRPNRGPEILIRRPHPAVVASHNAFPHCTEAAMKAILSGKPVVDAVVEGVTLVENDPEDHSVGLGGIPNEEGVVELDASVMDGASGLSGAVASIRNIKNPASVALRVLRYTDHCLLVGEGALRFAKAHGFKEEELLTDDAREIWLYWKGNLSSSDKWFAKDLDQLPAGAKKWLTTTGTVNCCGVDRNGQLAGTTTTSGLAFKIPGRVGDSPIVGAGLYVDNDAGAAGCAGRGGANIISCGSLIVVVAVRGGAPPLVAGKEAAERIVRLTKAKHLLDARGRPTFNVNFYAVDKQGRTGGFAIKRRDTYAVFDEKGNRQVPLDSVFAD